MVNLDLDDPADRRELFRTLDDINFAETASGRPMLSAVVVSRENGMPGTGFLKVARKLGRLAGGDELDFWVRELGRVHAHWRPSAIEGHWE